MKSIPMPQFGHYLKLSGPASNTKKLGETDTKIEEAKIALEKFGIPFQVVTTGIETKTINNEEKPWTKFILLATGKDAKNDTFVTNPAALNTGVPKSERRFSSDTLDRFLGNLDFYKWKSQWLQTLNRW